MGDQQAFTSQKIAKALSRTFGGEVRTFSVTMKHRRVVGDFVRKIETAHKNAGKSTLVFRGSPHA